MRLRIRAFWADYSVESIVDGLAEREEQVRAFAAVPGLIQVIEEPCEAGEPCGTWLHLPIPVGAAR